MNSTFFYCILTTLFFILSFSCKSTEKNFRSSAKNPAITSPQTQGQGIFSDEQTSPPTPNNNQQNLESDDQNSLDQDLGLDGVNQECLSQTNFDNQTLQPLLDIEKEIVIATNKFRSAPSNPPRRITFRRASAQPPIVWDHCLSLIARNWSRTMSQRRFEHNNLNTVMTEFQSLTGQTLYTVSENIAFTSAGQGSAADIGANFVFQQWANSDGHYWNMLGEDHKAIGVGIWIDGSAIYATQVFR